MRFDIGERRNLPLVIIHMGKAAFKANQSEVWFKFNSTTLY